MPREKFYDKDAKSWVEVGWARDGNRVNLGVNSNLVEDSEQPQLLGYFADLDRAEINSLIAALRRARDQAYGRDE